MSQQWFCRVNGKDHGPFTSKRLKQLAVSGKLRATDLVWTEGKQPRPASQVKGLLPSGVAESNTSEQKAQHTPSEVDHPSKPSVPDEPVEVSSGVPSFFHWYGTKWPSKRKWYWQVLIWLIYGFAWIPLWYFVSATKGGIKDRWCSLGLSGKAICCLPVLALCGMVFWSFAGSPNRSGESGVDPAVAQAVDENLSTLPESFSQIEKTWSLPSPKLQKVARWSTGLGGVRDRTPTNPFQHNRYIVFDGNDGDTIRIWNRAGNEEVLPKSETCDYFNRLVAFSESGDYLACVDGDLIRIWSINGNTATLTSSVSAPSAPAWNSISWQADSSVFVQVLMKKSVFPRVTELKVTNGKADAAIELFSDLKLRDFRASSGEFSPKSRQMHLMTYAYEKQESSEPILSPNDEFERLKQNGGRRPKKKFSVVPTRIDLLQIGAKKASQARSLPESEDGVLYPCFARTCAEADQFLSGFAFSDPNLWAVVSSTQTKQKTLFVFDVSDWREVARIQLDSNDDLEDEPAVFVAVSNDDRFVVQRASTVTRSSRGRERKTTLTVWDLSKSEKTFQQSFVGELVDASFVDDASVFGTIDSGDGWEIFRVDLSARKMRIVAEGKGEPGRVCVSPDGDHLIFGGILWDRHGFEQIHTLIAEGIQQYQNGNWDDARKNFATVLLDPMAQNMSWKRDTDFPELWSRCFDCYAAEKRNDEGEQLLMYCDDNGIDVSPKVEEGKNLLSNIRTRQEEERSRIAKEEQQRAEAALAQIRADNQSKFTPAEKLTRAEFVEVLRDAMSRGRLDTTGVNAVFDNYSFQDRIGRPDRDLSYVDSKRLYYYRCRDGVVGLTVTVVRSYVFVSDIDLY